MNKAIKLKFEPSFDFVLIALVSSEPLYKLSWFINEHLSILLKETKPLQNYHQKKQVVQEFARFSFFAPDETNYHLIQNKGQQGLLIEEQKQIDYWLKIENANINSEEVLQSLKSIKNLSLALNIKPGSLKSKNRLVFSEDED